MEPQVKGLVIISLPPSEDQPQGKTIAAAFTLSDSPLPISQPNQNQQQLQQQHPSEPNRVLSLKMKVSTVRLVLAIMGICFLAFLIRGSVFSNTKIDSDPSGDHGWENSFVFALHSKSESGVSQEDAALKLGRFVRRDELRNRRIKPAMIEGVSSINSSTVFPLRGNVYPDGLYYASILVGNPPKPYYLDVDTGSDLTWIQCDAPCSSCAKGPHPLYKPTKGKIVPSKDSLCLEVQNNQNLKHCESCQQCDYEIEYADHSSSMGVLARDSLQLMITNGTLVKTSVIFGCAYDQQGPLLLKSPAKTDGILGLSSAKVSLLSQLADQGIVKNVIGHCMTSDIKGGGYMFFGDDFLPLSGLTWAPMLNSPSINFYHSDITKISYGGRQLDGLVNNAGQVVFDSGSSYTYFPKKAYTSLVTSLKNIVREALVLDESDSTLPLCWRTKSPVRSAEDVKQFFKPLTLHFPRKWLVKSRTFDIPPEGYLVISDKGNPCLGILDGSKVHDGATIILGDISLRGKLIMYDNAKKEIGWMQSDCIKPQTLKSFPFF